jgi:4-aminobutyrate aminotransferase-like enzyme
MAATILHGVLAIRANNQPETLLIMPPLVITEEDVDDVVAAIGAAASVVGDAQ